MPVMNIDLDDGKPPVVFALKPEDAQRFTVFLDTCNGYKKALDAGMEGRTVYQAPKGMRMVPEGDVAELAQLRLRAGGALSLPVPVDIDRLAKAITDTSRGGGESPEQATRRRNLACGEAAGVLRILARELGRAGVAPFDDWLTAQHICDVDPVDDALRAFAEDQTGDNATAIVRAVLESVTADYPDPGRLGIDGVPLQVKELALLLAGICWRIRNGHDARARAQQAVEYLQRKRLLSPLRGEQSDLPPGGKTER